MTLARLSLAAVVGTTLGASTTPSPSPAPPISASATAVLVQAPAGATPRVGAPSVLPAAARRLAAAGADVTVVYDTADATAAAIRAAGTHRAVLGTGPAVRQALALTATDHPAVRFGPLG